MYREQLDPVARIMVRSYFATRDYSRTFTDEQGSPPTLMAKAHHLRSIVQAKVTIHPDYELGKTFAEFGRVEITHTDSSTVFVLRSEGAVAAERRTAEQTLLDANEYLELRPRLELLLVYNFGAAGLSLALAGAYSRPKSTRLEMVDRPHLVDVWPYHDHGDDDPGSFDQGVVDPFKELGDLDFGEEHG